jgi:hypothetical protein
MEQAPLDFESSASTSFTTPAIGVFISNLPKVVNTLVEPVAGLPEKIKSDIFPI